MKKAVFCALCALALSFSPSLGAEDAALPADALSLSAYEAHADFQKNFALRNLHDKDGETVSLYKNYVLDSNGFMKEEAGESRFAGAFSDADVPPWPYKTLENWARKKTHPKIRAADVVDGTSEDTAPRSAVPLVIFIIFCAACLCPPCHKRRFSLPLIHGRE